MRTSVGVLGGAVVMFTGYHGLSYAADSVSSTAASTGNETYAAYNTSREVFSGIGQAAGPGIIWMGVAALVLVSIGYLVASARTTR